MAMMIKISSGDMKTAGWKMSRGKDGKTVFSKGIEILYSRSSRDFIADCAGDNFSNDFFEELGLLDLPHDFL